MRFVSFNIHHGTVGRKGPVDPERLGEVCAGFEADVIALQEVDQRTLRVKGVDLAAVAAEACGMAHVFGASTRLPGGRYGNAILARGSIERTSVTRLPKVPRHRFLQEQRTVLEASVVVDGRALHVACTHLAVKQWNNGPQLEVLLARLQRAPSPMVALGDLNRRSGAVRPLAEEAGVRLVAHGPTYPAGQPRTDIDHVLTSAGITVLGAEVRSTPMSDHAALVVDLDLGPAASA